MKFFETWSTGQVVRKHTMENIRAENIAEHTWGVVLLLMMCWPNIPRRIITAAQIHDCGEKATGDMPATTKWGSPTLEREIEKLEREALVRTMPEHFVEAMREMSDSDWAVVEFFDRLEFCLSMSRERRLGNTYSLLYYRRALRKAEETYEQHHADFSAKDPVLDLNMKKLLKEVREELHILEVL